MFLLSKKANILAKRNLCKSSEITKYIYHYKQELKEYYLINSS